MNVLVTGGAGFIGSQLVDHLLSLGHQVSVLDDLSSGRRENLSPDARLIQLDLRSPELEARLAELRPELVYHLAAQVSVQRSSREPLLDADVNVLGSLRLLEAATRLGLRKLVYVSTAAVYGEPEQLPVPETHPLRPMSPYGVSKLTVERYLPLYAARGLDYSVLRLANVYGPRQDPAGEAGVVAIFAGNMLAGRPCTIFGDGRQARDFVYVADCARAAACLLAAGSGGTYNIGSGGLTSVAELHAALARILGHALPALPGPARAGEIHRLALDPGRAAAELGWRAETALETGLAETLRAFAAAGPSPA